MKKESAASISSLGCLCSVLLLLGYVVITLNLLKSFLNSWFKIRYFTIPTYHHKSRMFGFVFHCSGKQMCHFKCSNVHKVSCFGSRVWLVCSRGMAFCFFTLDFTVWLLLIFTKTKDLNGENYREK